MRPSAIYDSVLPHTSCPGAVERRCYHISVEDQQEEGWASPVVVGKLSKSNDVHEDTEKELVVTISHTRILAGQSGGTGERNVDWKHRAK